MPLPNNIPKIPVPATAQRIVPPMPPIPPAPLKGNLPKPPSIPMPPVGNLPKPPSAPVGLKPAISLAPSLKPEEKKGPSLQIPGVDPEEQAKAKLEALKKNVAAIQGKEEETEEDANELNQEDVNEAENEVVTPKEVESENDEAAEKEAKKNKAKSKTKTSKKAAQKETTSKESDSNGEDDEDYITIKLKPTCKDFDIIEEKVFGTFNDPKWEALKEEVIELNSQIIIESDMSIGSLKTAIANLSALRNKILILYIKYQTNFQNLVSDKPEGIIERVKRLSSKGSNDNERRRNGILACMQYEMGGEIIDLFELLEQTRERYNFFKGIMDAIEQKQKALITMNSAIIMEQKLD